MFPIKIGKDHHRWKGGVDINKGYLRINLGDGNGRKYKHTLVMENHIGRKLNKGEVVHHIDGNRQNNNISNLKLFPSNAEHIKAHGTMKTGTRKWSKKYAKCIMCGKSDKRHISKGRCDRCFSRIRRGCKEQMYDNNGKRILTEEHKLNIAKAITEFRRKAKQ